METINRYIMFRDGDVQLAEHWLDMFLQVILQKQILNWQEERNLLDQSKDYFGLVCITKLVHRPLDLHLKPVNGKKKVQQEPRPLQSEWGSERATKLLSSKPGPLFTHYFHQTCLPLTKTMNHPLTTLPPPFYNFQLCGW